MLIAVSEIFFIYLCYLLVLLAHFHSSGICEDHLDNWWDNNQKGNAKSLSQGHIKTNLTVACTNLARKTSSNFHENSSIYHPSFLKSRHQQKTHTSV